MSNSEQGPQQDANAANDTVSNAQEGILPAHDGPC